MADAGPPAQSVESEPDYSQKEDQESHSEQMPVDFFFVKERFLPEGERTPRDFVRDVDLGLSPVEYPFEHNHKVIISCHPYLVARVPLIATFDQTRGIFETAAFVDKHLCICQ